MKIIQNMFEGTIILFIVGFALVFLIGYYTAIPFLIITAVSFVFIRPFLSNKEGIGICFLSLCKYFLFSILKVAVWVFMVAVFLLGTLLIINLVVSFLKGSSIVGIPFAIVFSSFIILIIYVSFLYSYNLLSGNNGLIVGYVNALKGDY